mmetsp:Transcript_66914/g.217683  ORF Transcript_66914/g.217683 Transcript_66914/m.217683 type:complete len:292 (+) Transcript_66914:2714-3589(+)
MGSWGSGWARTRPPTASAARFVAPCAVRAWCGACCAAMNRSNSPFKALGDSVLHNFRSNSAPLPLSCCSSASNRCEVLADGLHRVRAQATASSSTCFVEVVNGISTALLRSLWPRPTNSSSSALARTRSTPYLRRAWQPGSDPSARMPTTNISAPTQSSARRFASSCASTMALMARSEKWSKSALLHTTVPAQSAARPHEPTARVGNVATSPRPRPAKHEASQRPPTTPRPRTGSGATATAESADAGQAAVCSCPRHRRLLGCRNTTTQTTAAAAAAHPPTAATAAAPAAA